MITRTMAPSILRLAKHFPVITITGPRQSGKTTLAKALFPHYAYHNLENPDVLAAAQADPRTFLKLGTKDPMIIDEVQRYPELLSYMQDEVDTQKLSGRYIITG
ncbi:AAA family ATPase, partial [Candidatus Gottesmanbacteria bacterium]|nr:AAA family ATPase [Candidatus Gottesmanbacteria bacterium]